MTKETKKKTLEAAENDPSLEAEKLRLITAQADKIELEMRIKRGEYVPVVMADKYWGDMVYGFRSKILTIPRALSQELAQEADPVRCEEIMQKALEMTLMELSKSSLEHKAKSGRLT